MMNYYIVHDVIGRQIGFAPMDNDSDKMQLTWGAVPENYFDPENPYDPTVVDRAAAFIFMAVSCGSGISIFFVGNYLLYKLIILKDEPDEDDDKSIEP